MGGLGENVGAVPTAVVVRRLEGDGSIKRHHGNQVLQARASHEFFVAPCQTATFPKYASGRGGS